MSENKPPRPGHEPEYPRIGGKRPVVGPILGLVGLVALVVVIYLVLTYLQHHT